MVEALVLSEVIRRQLPEQDIDSLTLDVEDAGLRLSSGCGLHAPVFSRPVSKHHVVRISGLRNDATSL